jgi:hypothetical protein
MRRHNILIDIRLNFARSTITIAKTWTLLVLIFLVSGCGSLQHGEVQPETRFISIERPAPIPPGVVRYCWEEPIVAYEQRGPGLDIEGRWYSPAYVAVREVRQGRWRPCRPMLSELKGETKNER